MYYTPTSCEGLCCIKLGVTICHHPRAKLELPLPTGKELRGAGSTGYAQYVIAAQDAFGDHSRS